LIEEIAALRRKTPGVVTENIKKDYRDGIETDEKILQVVEAKVVGREKGVADMGIERLERQDQVEANWGKGVKALGGLMRTLPETAARKERAERAEEYVVKGMK
jgi:kinetochor protein Mis14/NSL1